MALKHSRRAGYRTGGSIGFRRVVPLLACLFWVSVCCEPLWAQTPLTAPAPEASPAATNSGIYGAMVAAWGNAPANPPTYECVKIFDAGGQKLVATGTCSGTWAQFRVPLAPGRYIIEKGETRTAIDVGPGQWVNLAPRQLPGPVP